MAQTRTKPCPLCRRVIPHTVGDVCSACRARFDYLSKLDEKLTARGEMKGYWIPVDHWPWSAPFQFHVSEELSKALSVMLLAITTPATNPQSSSVFHIPHFQDSYTRNQPRQLTHEGAESIRRFFTLLKKEFNRCASENLTHGKDLLAQLASGGITVEQLNRANVRPEE